MDIQVIRGGPDDEELAALVTVLTALGATVRPAAPESARRPGWLDVNAPSVRFTVAGSWSSRQRSRNG